MRNPSIPFILSALTSFGLAACAADDSLDGDLPFDGDSAGLGKADGVSVPVTPLAADIDFERREQGGRAIITSAAAWQRYFGTEAPAEVDFSRSWVAFYGAGLKNTGGFSAEITGLSFLPEDGGLVLSTRATSPGFDCLVTQALTTPHTLVTFAIPSPRPTFALADHADEVRRCSPSNADHLAALADSRRAWEAAKAQSGNSYTYSREFHSFLGFSSRTDFVVESGVVVERHFKAQHAGAPESRQWSELGAEVGSHDEAFPPLLIDALYDQCETEVLSQDEDDNFMSFALDQRGLLQVCTFFPKNCADDCGRGPVISNLEI
jgi:hypothetical protein